MNETTFREQFTNTLMKHFGKEVYVQKNHGSVYSAGLPDLQVCLEGQWWALELKHVKKGTTIPSGQPTRLQWDTLRRIRAAGGRAGVLALLTEPLPGVEAEMGVWAVGVDRHEEPPTLNTVNASRLMNWRLFRSDVLICRTLFTLW